MDQFNHKKRVLARSHASVLSEEDLKHVSGAKEDCQAIAQFTWNGRDPDTDVRFVCRF